MHNLSTAKLNAKQQLVTNVLTGVGYIALGTATAFAVNKLACYLFSIDEDSNAAYVAKTVAFAAGVAASIYLAPRTAIYSFAGGEACKHLGMEAAVAAISVLFLKKELASRICVAMGMTSLGSIVGYGGRVALISFGAIGAAIGAIF